MYVSDWQLLVNSPQPSILSTIQLLVGAAHAASAALPCGPRSPASSGRGSWLLGAGSVCMLQPDLFACAHFSFRSVLRRGHWHWVWLWVPWRAYSMAERLRVPHNIVWLLVGWCDGLGKALCWRRLLGKHCYWGSGSAGLWDTCCRQVNEPLLDPVKPRCCGGRVVGKAAWFCERTLLYYVRVVHCRPFQAVLSWYSAG